MPNGAFDEENDFVRTEEAKPAEQSTAVIVLKGILGAVLGSLPSVFLWIVLGKAGYVAAIGGFFMMLGELYACDFFTKKSGQMNVQTAMVICAAVMLLNVWLCERFVWSWELRDIIRDMAAENVTVLYCFTNFDSIIEAAELRTDFDNALMRSYAFAALGAVAACVKLFKKN